MVGARGAAHRPVVEYDVAVHVPGHAAHGVEVAVDALRCVSACRDGKVFRQNGEGVYQNLIMLLHHQRMLLLGAVQVAEETGAFGNALSIGFRSCADNACRVPLGLQ